MNIIIMGAAGFIGTNLAMTLANDQDNQITLVDRKRDYFQAIEKKNYPNVKILESDFSVEDDYDQMLKNQDIVYHLVSTTIPTNSNQHILDEVNENISFSSALLEACVHQNVKKVVFLSSGGTIYGKEAKCPLDEKTPTYPITTYGIQKLTIEKLIYLYRYLYNLDYRIIRLANPYGPYQRPNGVLGVITTFVYKALSGEDILVYGDGSVVRDFIYIDDAVKGILNIVNGTNRHRTFNLGSGYGTSVKQVVDAIGETLDINLSIKYMEARKVDVPVNYLDIKRYEDAYGKLNPISLNEGIKKTAEFMKDYYNL
ncbi:MAG: NAD-dependent epimerase/dehydratase family protein [Eubacterium sp.]|nr:NAD-dependent epimerase/dehydratase family protein [Eubacterium sp.]